MVFFCEFLLEASPEKAGNGSRDSFFAPAVADAFNDSINAELNLVVRSGQSNKGCNTLLTHADANTVFAVSAVACMELCDVRSRSTAVQKLNGFHAEIFIFCAYAARGNAQAVACLLYTSRCV